MNNLNVFHVNGDEDGEDNPNYSTHRTLLAASNPGDIQTLTPHERLLMLQMCTHMQTPSIYPST